MYRHRIVSQRPKSTKIIFHNASTAFLHREVEVIFSQENTWLCLCSESVFFYSQVV